MIPQDNSATIEIGTQQTEVVSPETVTATQQPKPTPPSVDAEKKSGEVDDKNIGSGKEGEDKSKEHTRSTMALLFVLGFFAILFLCYAYAITVGATLSELKEALIAIIGSLSGMIGFIVGYYYKSAQEK